MTNRDTDGLGLVCRTLSEQAADTRPTSSKTEPRSTMTRVLSNVELKGGRDITTVRIIEDLATTRASYDLAVYGQPRHIVHTGLSRNELCQVLFDLDREHYAAWMDQVEKAYTMIMNSALRSGIELWPPVKEPTTQIYVRTLEADHSRDPHPQAGGESAVVWLVKTVLSNQLFFLLAAGGQMVPGLHTLDQTMQWLKDQDRSDLITWVHKVYQEHAEIDTPPNESTDEKETTPQVYGVVAIVHPHRRKDVDIAIYDMNDGTHAIVGSIGEVYRGVTSCNQIDAVLHNLGVKPRDRRTVVDQVRRGRLVPLP